MKKVICPSCQVVQEVEETSERFICQDCLKTHDLQQGIKIYNMLYSQYVQLGNNALNIVRDFQKAKINYERLIVLDPTNLAAIFGLLEVKISLTKLDESVVNDVISSLEAQKGHIFNQANDEFKILSQYTILLKRYEEYFFEAKKLLTKDHKFLNLAAKEKTISLINDLILINEYVQNLFNSHFSDEHSFLEQVSNNLNMLEDLLNTNEQVAIISSDQVLPVAILEKEVISNKIKQYRFQLTLSILQFVFGIGALISFILMSKHAETNPFPSLISAGVFILLIFIIHYGRKIYKKRV